MKYIDKYIGVYIDKYIHIYCYQSIIIVYYIIYDISMLFFCFIQFVYIYEYILYYIFIQLQYETYKF
jgi:hypothetical protein